MLTRRSMGAGAAMLALAAARAPAPFTWPGGARAAVSLSYDDGLDSQLAHAVPALDAAGLKATFFLTKDNVGPALGDWVRVARSGHEIGHHTVSHPCDLQAQTPASFAANELIPMQDWLDLNFGKSAGGRVYAYPCSVTNLGSGGPNAQLRRYEALLRAIGVRAARACDDDGPNTVAHARAHPFRLLAAAPTYDADDATRALAYVQQAIAQGGWAILAFHDVAPARTSEGATSIATHAAALDWLKSQPVWCAPIGRVLDAIAVDRIHP